MAGTDVVTITMGGSDVTSTAYTAATKKVNIATVTGAIVITVAAAAQGGGGTT